MEIESVDTVQENGQQVETKTNENKENLPTQEKPNSNVESQAPPEAMQLTDLPTENIETNMDNVVVIEPSSTSSVTSSVNSDMQRTGDLPPQIVSDVPLSSVNSNDMQITEDIPPQIMEPNMDNAEVIQPPSTLSVASSVNSVISDMQLTGGLPPQIAVIDSNVLLSSVDSNKMQITEDLPPQTMETNTDNVLVIESNVLLAPKENSLESSSMRLGIISQESPSIANNLNVIKEPTASYESTIETPVIEDMPIQTSVTNAESVNLQMKLSSNAYQESFVKLTTNEVTDSTETNKQSSPAATSLSLICQYASSDEDKDTTAAIDSDADSVIEVPLSTTTKGYRNQVVEIDSDSDSDSSSDNESKVEYLRKIRSTIDQRTRDFDDDDDEDDFEGGNKTSKKRQPPKVKGEMLLDDLPPIQDLHITVPSEECVELGRVHSIVDQLVLVNVKPNSILLDLETVLFLESGRKVLGEVFDVLGQVADPMYCVRFNTHAQIEERGIKVGDIVYVAPKTEYTQFVILSSLTQFRGSDASWENDVEPPPRYLDYSDDEQEREARIKSRNKNRTNDCDEQIKRTRIDNSEETNSEASTSSRRPQQQQKQHHGRRNFPSYPPSYHQSNYNANSWHSNFNRQPQRGNFSGSQNYNMTTAQPHNNHPYISPQNSMYSQPPPLQQFYPNAQMSTPPPPFPHIQQSPHLPYGRNQNPPSVISMPPSFSAPPPSFPSGTKKPPY